MEDNKSAHSLLNSLIERINQDETAQLRLKAWENVTKWQIDDESFYWRFGDGKVIDCAPETRQVNPWHQVVSPIRFANGGT